MLEKQVTLCQHNQTGFCKFSDKCQKRHENTVCEYTEYCKKDTCNKRHPKECRNFRNNENCKYKEKCAYKHVQTEKHTDLNELFKQGLLKHEIDIKILTEEVQTLKQLVQEMALELAKHVQKEGVVIKVKEKENPTELNEKETQPCEAAVRCDRCEFTCAKVITLNKHMNTKHMEKKLKNNIGSKQGNNKKNSFG